MAWRAECKRRNWNCVIEWDAISWYSKYLYDEWLKSLTPAQIKRLEECHQKEKERKQKELENAFINFVDTCNVLSRFWIQHPGKDIW